MFDSIFETVIGDENPITVKLLVVLCAALVLGIVISLVYQKTHRFRAPSHSFSLTLAVLPAVITIIIMLVGNSVARAFSLAGAFSIIRFRSAPADSKDITYVLMSMAVGLCCGMGYLLYGVIAAVLLCAVMIALKLTKFGQPKTVKQILRITVPEDLDYQHAFDDVLAQYTKHYRRTRVRTTDLGSLFELYYVITAKDNIDEKAFLDALRCRNGNLNIILALDEQPSDF